MSADRLDAKKIGYLRRVPADPQGRTLNGPLKAMWNKLVRSGHVEIYDGCYVRTPLGNQALQEFDDSLSEHAIAIIVRLSDGAPVKHDERGLQSLISAGLVNCNIFNGELTPGPGAREIVELYLQKTGFSAPL